MSISETEYKYYSALSKKYNINDQVWCHTQALPFFHHLIKRFTPPSIPIIFFELKFFNFDNSFDDVLLPFSSAAFPVIEILKVKH